ncbi:hypothetical protein CVU83_01215 [Candidatus Falkowbacteria bacterium HGW-Falkowbacteria-2]|uniref:Uncharacterized protein n=1 Tax=Candidatus Falkowbacteria bacterium HGW-Falkowbacteria-2 TaxID=2013769 RepID=A0A2N2E200_9BACT|nr:MAG: hypothetical protein CVU83_01215 [Candidatus Falkowbacteria bacterium HGW-Falkowbacteria-2]
MKIARAALIGAAIFAYIPLTFFVYFIVIGLIYDVDWFNISLMQLAPSFAFILAWILFPIGATYLIVGRKALKK